MVEVLARDQIVSLELCGPGAKSIVEGTSISEATELSSELVDLVAGNGEVTQDELGPVLIEVAEEQQP